MRKTSYFIRLFLICFSVPLEVKILEREYFNRWYGLKAYYMAMTVANLPMLIILGVLFSCIVYFLTYQPWDINRFLLFVIMAIFVGITSQGLGFAIGTMFPITVRITLFKFNS